MFLLLSELFLGGERGGGVVGDGGGDMGLRCQEMATKLLAM